MISDFPVLNQRNGRNLTYLDSAATTLKPKQVIEAVMSFYQKYTANVHRGIYQESEEATEKYESVRSKAAKLINVRSEEIIFTNNTTEAINLVAKTWGKINIKKGSIIVSSVMEHHSNLVPWQELAKQKGAKLVFINIDEYGQLDLTSIDKILKGASLLAITHVSNVLGTINPVRKLTKTAHKAGALVLIDGAQAVGHMPVDVVSLGCDFYTFSAHKMLGPSGVGVLWMRKKISESLPPYLFGGGMISKVTLENTEYLETPRRFEAGTPNIEGVIGFGAAIDYLKHAGLDKIRRHEEALTAYALGKLSRIKGLIIYGSISTSLRGGIIAFNIEGVHPHDLASCLDKEGIAVRAGHHCAMPLHRRLGISSSVRISFHTYNNREDVDRLAESLKKLCI